MLKDFGRELPVDPKMIEEIQSSPAMLAEQGSGFMQDWGGPQMYREMAYAPENARIIYYVVLEGNTDPSQLEVITGLSKEEVERGLGWLQRKGHVKLEEVS